MFSIRTSWIFCFFNCFIFLTSSSVSRPGVRTLLTTRGLNFVRKLAVPVIIKKMNNLEISPISGNIDYFFGNLNYKFKNIKLSEVKIPKSRISILNGTGLSVEGTGMTIKVDELWDYEFTSWPFISDKGSATVSVKRLSLNIIIGVSKGSKEEPSVTAKDCTLNIGKLDVEFHGVTGVLYNFLYNFFMIFIKDKLKNELEDVICRNAIKAVNKEINATLRTIPDEERMLNDTLKTNYDLVRPPQFPHNGVESDFKGEFLNVKHPKTPPYTPEELPPIRDEHSKMIYIWITAYTINTAFFAVNQSGSQFIFDSNDLPDGAPVELNTNAFIFVLPSLYFKYPDKDMAIGYRSSAPAKITLNPGDASVTLFGMMTFYVILDNNKLVDCFTLNVVEVARIDDILIFRKDNYSYFGLKLSSSRTDVTLQETHIGDFDLTLLRFTVDILAQFILSRYISPKMEEGFRLPLPKNVVLTNSDTAIGKNYILIFTDFEMTLQMTL